MELNTPNDIAYRLREGELSFDEARRKLTIEFPATLQAIWQQYMWDKNRRYVHTFRQIGHSFNPKRLELDEKQSMRKLGLLTEEEGKPLLEQLHEDLRIFLKEKAGDALTDEEVAFKKTYELYVKKSENVLSEDEFVIEDKWEAIRFAWVIECHTKHGDDFARMIYKGELQPPPDAVFDYKLPQKRPS